MNLPKVVKAFSTYKPGEFVKPDTDPAWRAKMILKGYLAMPEPEVQTPIVVEFTEQPAEPVAEPTPPEPTPEATEEPPKPPRKRKTESLE